MLSYLVFQILRALEEPNGVLVMANTFSQIYIQTVFAVSNRLSLIQPGFKEAS